METKQVVEEKSKTKKTTEKVPNPELDAKILRIGHSLVKLGQKDNNTLTKLRESVKTLKTSLKEAKQKKSAKTKAVSSEVTRMAEKVTQKIIAKENKATVSDAKKLAGRIVALDSDQVGRTDLMRLASVCMEAALPMEKPKKSEKPKED